MLQFVVEDIKFLCIVNSSAFIEPIKIRISLVIRVTCKKALKKNSVKHTLKYIKSTLHKTNYMKLR